MLFQVSINIEIIDLDDTAPEFYNLPSSFEISEFNEASGDDFNPNNTVNEITPIISVTDLDIPQEFWFELTAIKNTPNNLIEIVSAKSSDEAILHVINKIDRENSEIDDLNGILWYNLTVFDNANNENTAEVSV